MKRFSLSTAFLASGASLCLALPAFAKSVMSHGMGSRPSMMGRSSHLSSTDQHFITEAAQGGMAEVQLGSLASKKGSNRGVKAFGQRMVQDHSKANQELMKLATMKGAPLPKSIGGKHQAIYSRLSRLSGAAFDSAYMSDMVEDHQEDVAAFQKASRTAHDPALKGWASKTLPTLKEHLRMATQTKQSLHSRSKGKM